MHLCEPCGSAKNSKRSKHCAVGLAIPTVSPAGLIRHVEQTRRIALQSAIADWTQLRKTFTLSSGQQPSHGIVPFSNLLRIAGACRRTSFTDHRSKTKLIDSRSIFLKSGLMCRAKLTGSFGPGTVTEVGTSSFEAIAEALVLGLASQTHHQRGTGMFGGGDAFCCEFSLPMREPHSR